jgi:uncharacterized protein involved in exopolysaccharide biosynthesis
MITTRFVVAVFFRHLRKVALAFLGVVLLGVAYLLTATPRYESTASLVFRFGGNARPEVSREAVTRTSAEERREIVASAMKLFESRDLAEAVIRSVGLDTIYPDLAAAPGLSDDKRMAIAARRLLGQDIALRNERDTTVLQVSALSTDPAVAQEVARHLVREFVRMHTQVYENPQADFLAGQVDEARDRLKESQRVLYDYRDKTGISNPDVELELLLEQRKEVSSELARHVAAEADARARQGSLGRSLKTVPKQVSVGTEGRFGVVDDIQRALQDLKEKESLLLQTYAPSSPVIESLRAQMASKEKELKAGMRGVAGRSKPVQNPVIESLEPAYLKAVADQGAEASQVEAYRDKLAALDADIARLSSQKARHDDLVRQVEMDEETFRLLHSKVEEARVSSALSASDITRIGVIQAPAYPFSPSKPNRPLVLALVLVAATIAAGVVLVVAQALDERISMAEQIPRQFGLPVLATFPRRSR